MRKGEIIKNLREKKGLSQTELAMKLNTTKQTIYKYENDIITNIPSDKIEGMANLFDVSPAYIMGWDDAPKSSKELYKSFEGTTISDSDFAILKMYTQLDDEDKAEIRGEIKQMLKSPKYNKTNIFAEIADDITKLMNMHTHTNSK